jgi:PadR family transcriptional regulator AphA
MPQKLPKLSPTSYALLGLLARRPATAYELNSSMQTSLMRVYWPRAESHVYSEPKKLLAHELVSERAETLKGRKRTVYTITEGGLAALKIWLEQAGSTELRSQSEFMLKLILANLGTTAAATDTLETSFASSKQDLEDGVAGITRILGHSGWANDGMPWNGIVINLMAETLAARHRWNQYALEQAGSIDDEQTEEQRKSQGREAYARALATMQSALEN